MSFSAIVPTSAFFYHDIGGLGITEYGLNIDRTSQELGTFKIFSAEELADRELGVANGKLVVGLKQAQLHTELRALMIVMHPDRRMYVEYPVEGVCHHSSLIGQHWPIAVGMVRGLQGRMTKIDENSRHFLSQGRLWLIFQELNKRGARIHPSEVSISSLLLPNNVECAVIASPSERQKRLGQILASKRSLPITQERSLSFAASVSNRDDKGSEKEIDTKKKDEQNSDCLALLPPKSQKVATAVARMLENQDMALQQTSEVSRFVYKKPPPPPSRRNKMTFPSKLNSGGAACSLVVQKIQDRPA